MAIVIWFVVSILILYISWFFLDEASKRKHLPPGPPVLPLVGSSLHMAWANSKPHLAFVKLAGKYGDIMRVKLGAHEYVVLSSLEVLNEILSKEETLGRPGHGVLKDRTQVPNAGIAEDFNQTFTQILLASLEPLNSNLKSLMLFLTVFTDKQEKIHTELTTIFQLDHVLSFSDLKQLPYTEAFMLEVHRLSMVVTNWLPRTLTADIKFRDFILKKGTTFLSNPQTAFKSKAIFGSDPDTFLPERFLNPNDPTKITNLKKHNTAFSIGKPDNPGQSVAQIVSFETMVSTVKNFRLSCVSGENPALYRFLCGNHY